MAKQQGFIGMRIEKELENNILFLAEQKNTDKSKYAKTILEVDVKKEMKRYPPEQYEEWKAKREMENK